MPLRMPARLGNDLRFLLWCSFSMDVYLLLMWDGIIRFSKSLLTMLGISSRPSFWSSASFISWCVKALATAMNTTHRAQTRRESIGKRSVGQKVRWSYRAAWERYTVAFARDLGVTLHLWHSSSALYARDAPIRSHFVDGGGGRYQNKGETIKALPKMDIEAAILQTATIRLNLNMPFRFV